MSHPEIRFIPNEDFESASERNLEEVDIELHAAEEGRCGPVDRNEKAATFLRAIEESRILTFEGEQFMFKRFNSLRFRANALHVTLSAKRPKKILNVIERLIQGAQETREEIVRANLRLTAPIARKRFSSPEDFDEYVSEANGILQNATDKFAYSRSCRFSTHATDAMQQPCIP